MTNRAAGAVGNPNSSARPSAVRPRVTTAKALSACECAAAAGSGRWTRSRWSRLGLTKLVDTRTARSSARSSKRVSTSTRCSPTRACEPPSTWSGQAYVAVMRALARTGPRSVTSIATASGVSTTESCRGGE